MDPNDISNLVAELNLEKEAEEAVVEISLDGDSQEPQTYRNRVETLVVGKIFATRVANRETLRIHIPRILQIREEADIEIVGDNLFVIIFNSVRDRNHALYDGPWHFFESYMAFKKPRGLEKPSDVQFTEFSTWVQCHNLPIMCMNPVTIRRIGEAVGKVEEIDEGEGGNCLGQYARVRITREITKPLQRCVKITLGNTPESQTVLIRYERLPEFCSACGRVGHVVRHCQDSSVDKSKKAFGPWLKATRTQELRRQRNTPIRKEKNDGKPSDSEIGETAWIRQQPSREEGTDENGGDGNIEISHKLTAERVSTALSIIPVPEQERPQRGMDLEVDREGRNKKEGTGINDIQMLPEVRRTEEEARPKANQHIKEKASGRGWKRRARETHWRVGDQTATTCKKGRKREGDEGINDEDSIHKLKQLRTTYTSQDTEETAEAAAQPRRSP